MAWCWGYSQDLMKTLLPFLPLVFACKSVDDTRADVEIPPWVFLEPAEPEEFNPILSTELEGAVAPTDMAFISRRSFLFVQDRAAGRVHVLDDRYRHSQEVFCVSAEIYGEGEYRSDRHRGNCPPEHVQQRRGVLEADTPIVAMNANSERLELHFLTESGRFYKLNVDLMEQSGLEFLRLPEEYLDLDRSFSGKSVLKIAGNWAWIASGSSLLAINHTTGEFQVEYELPGEVLDFEFLDGSALVATSVGLWQTDGLMEDNAIVTDLFRNRSNEVYAVVPEAETVRRLNDGLEVAIPGVVGPVLSRSGTTAMWALAEDELVSFDMEEGELQRFPAPGAVSMVTVSKGEIALLSEDGIVTAVFDDTSLLAGEPLAVAPLAFAEQPRSMSEDEPCTGGEGNVELRVELAATNLEFLQDLPSPVGFGVTPHLARRARQCGLEVRFSNVLTASELDVGVLIHQQVEEECATDLDCYANFLVENAQVIASYGAGVNWVSGMASHYELGVNWVEGLIRSELSDRFLFFGLSVLAEVPHETDSRSKEVFPMEGTDKAEPWKVSSAEVVEYSFEDGLIALYPGDARAAFNLGGCPNLLVRECLLLNEGGGGEFYQEDIEVLSLLLRRRLAEREVDGGAAWTFHLPDVGVWDYTEDCVREAGVWTGDCDARLLQEWFFDVHQKFVLNGAVKWSRPSELPWP